MGIFLNTAISTLFVPGPRNTTLPALPTNVEYWPLVPMVFLAGADTASVVRNPSIVRLPRGRTGSPTSRTRAASPPPVTSKPPGFSVMLGGWHSVSFRRGRLLIGQHESRPRRQQVEIDRLTEMPSDGTDKGRVDHHLPADVVLHAQAGVIQDRSLPVRIQRPVEIGRENIA